jgi:sugar/nucleoside kinase (ribokinase family)
MDVIGVGDADVDIYLDVDHVPGQDEKVLARNVSFYPGGMVANFLVALSQVGTSCGFHGPVGDDEFGRTTLADLAAYNVDTSGAIVKPGARTYFCVVMLDGSGEKALVVAPTSCLFPQPEDVSAYWIAQARHLHTTAAVVATAIKAVQIAKGHGLTVSVDIEPSAADQGVAMQPLLSQVDVAFVNQRAAKLLGGTDSLEEAAHKIVSHGPEIVCVTMGAQGSLFVSQTEFFRAPAFSVDVVDSTGAGDCFAAGFVHGFLKGWSLAQAAYFASAMGALSVTRRGGHANLPGREEVLAFLAARDIDLSQ